MTIEKKIKVTIFNELRVYIYIGDTLKEAREYVEKKYGITFNNLSGEVAAFYSVITHNLKGEERNIIVLCNECSDYAVWHESLHTAFNILDQHGVKVDADNNEILAYLQGYIALEIINIIDKLKKDK